jgi:hypothetical protein
LATVIDCGIMPSGLAGWNQAIAISTLPTAISTRADWQPIVADATTPYESPV